MKLGAISGCHQMPERSFFFGRYQFPLCARCTGILVGEIVSLFLWNIWHPSLIIAIILIIPMAFDGLVQYMFFIMSNNRRRFITGFGAGYGLVNTYIYIFMAILALAKRTA